MKKLVASLAVALPTLALATDAWTIDPVHSSTGFAVRHLVIATVRGQFTKTTGTLKIDAADPARSSVEATIEGKSIDTREPQRDGHLRSPDFLDTARYPTITFHSTKVVPAGQDKLAVTGNLTLHGVTKPVTLEVSTSPEVKGTSGETRRGFTATTRINRKDFGLTWNKLLEAGPVVGDEVSIVIDVEATKDQPKSASN